MIDAEKQSLKSQENGLKYKMVPMIPAFMSLPLVPRKNSGTEGKRSFQTN